MWLMRLDNSWIKVLSYPKGDIIRSLRIWDALLSYGIRELINYGQVRIGNVNVLGKGHSSIVILARHESLGLVVVKIRRTDSKTPTLLHECNLMRKSYPIAPKIFYCSDDVIVREYVKGECLSDVVDKIKSCKEAVALILKVLGATYWLDLNNVDHKELSIPSKHILISKEGSVKIIDFESGRMRSACNVCRVVSWLIIRRDLLRKYCRVKDRKFLERAIKLLRDYKYNKENFKKLLSFIIKCSR